ncbi:hypothetical protein JZ751_002875, partial [Albula glossodonta]
MAELTRTGDSGPGKAGNACLVNPLKTPAAASLSVSHHEILGQLFGRVASFTVASSLGHNDEKHQKASLHTVCVADPSPRAAGCPVSEIAEESQTAAGAVVVFPSRPGHAPTGKGNPQQKAERAKVVTQECGEDRVQGRRGPSGSTNPIPAGEHKQVPILGILPSPGRSWAEQSGHPSDRCTREGGRESDFIPAHEGGHVTKPGGHLMHVTPPSALQRDTKPLSTDQTVDKMMAPRPHGMRCLRVIVCAVSAAVSGI